MNSQESHVLFQRIVVLLHAQDEPHLEVHPASGPSVKAATKPLPGLLQWSSDVDSLILKGSSYCTLVLSASRPGVYLSKPHMRHIRIYICQFSCEFINQSWSRKKLSSERSLFQYFLMSACLYSQSKRHISHWVHYVLWSSFWAVIWAVILFLFLPQCLWR